MKPFQASLLAAAIVLAGGAARAEGSANPATASQAPLADHWIELGAKDGMTRYVADAALIRQSDYAVIWRMQTFAAEQSSDDRHYRSIKYQVEYNCASHQRRGLYFEMYSGAMGSGRLVALSYDRAPWHAVTTDTAQGYQAACGVGAQPAVVASAP